LHSPKTLRGEKGSAAVFHLSRGLELALDLRASSRMETLSRMPEQAVRHRYLRRPDVPVVAVRLALETPGLVYRKWGGEQRAKAGDWLVDNDGDVYTVDADSFARTYRATGSGPGTYVKTTPIWATRAARAGAVHTKEGITHYEAGDYLVSNNDDDTDQYAVAAAEFERLYMLDEGPDRS
jgi:hypothetical protein